MTTNLQNTRLSSRPGDPPVFEATPTPIITPTGVSGVAVYDQDVDGRANSTLRPSMTPPLVRGDERDPVEVRTSGSIFSWIIGAIVLVVLVYFLVQLIF